MTRYNLGVTCLCKQSPSLCALTEGISHTSDLWCGATDTWSHDQAVVTPWFNAWSYWPTSTVNIACLLTNYTALSINTQQAHNNILLRTLFSSLFFFWVCQIVWMKQMNIPESSSLSRRGKYSNTRVKVCWQPCDTLLKWWPWTNRKQKYQMSKTIYLAMESRSW